MSERRAPRSPSQLTLYERCPKAWEYRYVKRVKLQTSWSVKGRACHAAIAASFTQKIERGVDLPVDDVVAIFHESVRRSFSGMGVATDGEVILFEDESEDQLRRAGAASLAVYMAEVAPTIQPVMVEEAVETTLPSGLPLRGVLDCIDDALRIRDAKFPTDKMRPDTLYLQNQPPLYAALYHAKMGTWPTFCFDVVASGRAKIPKPQAQRGLELVVTARHAAARVADLETVDAQIRAGNFPRRPSEQNCGKCVYRHACWFGILPPAAEAAADRPPAVAPRVLPTSDPAALALR